MASQTYYAPAKSKRGFAAVALVFVVAASLVSGYAAAAVVAAALERVVVAASAAVDGLRAVAGHR